MRKYQIVSKIGERANTKYTYTYVMAENKDNAIAIFRDMDDKSIIVQVKEVSMWV